MKKNESGFSALEVVLIIVVVGLIAGVGWYVWSQRQDKTPVSTSNTTTTSQTTPKTTQQPSAEFDQGTSTTSGTSVVYENKSLGLGFTYPAEWGKVTIIYNTPDPKAVSKSGQAYLISFDKHDKFTGAFVTKDYEIGNTVGLIGFTTYTACGKEKPASGETVVRYRIYDGEGVCVAATPTSGGQTPSASLEVEKQLTKSKYPGVVFVGLDSAITANTEAALKAVYTDAVVKPYVDFAKSMKEL